MCRSWPSFDELVQIAKEDPEQLEIIRQRRINEIIDAAPENQRARLRGLQFQVDCYRRIHKNPLASCISISKMMRDSLLELNEVLNGKLPEHMTDRHRQRQLDKNRESKNVIRFPVAS